MTIPDPVINLMQQRQKRFTPTVLKKPRSEDMRAVAEAQMRSGHGTVIHIDASSMRLARVTRDAVRAAMRFTVTDHATEQMKALGARLEAPGKLGRITLE